MTSDGIPTHRGSLIIPKHDLQAGLRASIAVVPAPAAFARLKRYRNMLKTLSYVPFLPHGQATDG